MYPVISSRLLKHLSGVRHVGPGQWRIWHDDGEEYSVRLAFDHTAPAKLQERALTDLGSAADSSTSPAHAKRVLFQFITQFEEIETRRPHEYELGTCEIIAQSAQYQKEILVQRSPIPAAEFDEIIVIAQLLRCLLISSEISDVNGNYTDFMDGSDIHVLRPEGEDAYWGLESSITIQRYNDDDRGRDHQIWKHCKGLPAILKKAIGNLQHLMFRRRPRDLPCLIYSFCLLALIVSSLRTLAPFMAPISPAADELDAILQTLCDLYLFCSGNVHPLVDDIDLSRYTSLSEDDTVAIKHFQSLNQLWREFGKIDSSQAFKAHTLIPLSHLEVHDSRVVERGFQSMIEHFAFYDDYCGPASG